MAQLVASMSGVMLGGVVEVVGSNLARSKIFTASAQLIDYIPPFIISLHINLFQMFSQIMCKNVL